MYSKDLTDYEKGEILDYSEIYYMGSQASKVRAQTQNVLNHGYDNEQGDYLIRINDHLNYRYEVVSCIGKGSFGQVIIYIYIYINIYVYIIGFENI